MVGEGAGIVRGIILDGLFGTFGAPKVRMKLIMHQVAIQPHPSFCIRPKGSKTLGKIKARHESGSRPHLML